MKSGWYARGAALARIAACALALLATPVAPAQVPSSCEILLSTTQVDYGRLSRVTMPEAPHGRLDLPARTVGMQVRCPDPQDMTVLFRGVPADEDEYRFSDSGRFALRLRDGRLDGAPVDLGRVDPETGVPTRSGPSLPWHPSQGLAPLKNGRPAAGREFSANIDIVAQVDDRAFTVADAARWIAPGSVELATMAATRDLTLQADIQPGRCNVEVKRHISFGRLRSTDINRRGTSTRISANQGGRLQVLCDAPMLVAFRITRDERADSAVAPEGLDATYPDARLFGLGKTPAGQNIGAYVLLWSARATSDRGELHATHSIDGGRSWAPANGALIADHDSAARVGYAHAEGTRTGPLAVKALDVALDATIFIAPASSLSIDDEVRADGLITVEIIY